MGALSGGSRLRERSDNVDKDDRELIDLKRRIAALTDEARKNEEAWQRSQRREMELLEADSLDTLFERLTTGLRASYRLRGGHARARRSRARSAAAARRTGQRARRA